MKKTLVFLLFLIFTTTIFANNAYDINLSCTQPTLNILKVSYFDPAEPYSQPTLFCLTTTIPSRHLNDGNILATYQLNIDFFWNGNRLSGTNLEPVLNQSISNEFGRAFSVTNRDLITSSDNNYFEADGNFSFEDIMDSNSQFKDFVLETGRLPDGNYRIDITLTPEDETLYDGDQASVSFSVRGIQSVRVISPGVIAGSTDIPTLFHPVIFNWTTSGFENDFVVEIKEFDQPYELDPSNIEFSGRLVEREDININTIYNPMYIFQEGKYYAWRAKVKFAGEESLNQDGYEQYLASNFYVFQFGCAPATDVPNAFQAELLKSLQNLNIAEINSLLEEGYSPKDGIHLNGKTYYGKEAVDKLRALFMTYSIEVSVE